MLILVLRYDKLRYAMLHSLDVAFPNINSIEVIFIDIFTYGFLFKFDKKVFGFDVQKSKAQQQQDNA